MIDEEQHSDVAHHCVFHSIYCFIHSQEANYKLHAMRFIGTYGKFGNNLLLLIMAWLHHSFFGG